MSVLVYLVRFTTTGSVGESVTPAGPVHSVVTVTGTSTAGLSTTVQVRVTSDPTAMVPLLMVTVGVGTRGEEEILCNVHVNH